MSSTKRPGARLLARDFTFDINDPKSSPLTEEQLKIVYVASELEDMFAAPKLPRAQRSLLLRLYEEVVGSGIADKDRRLHRAKLEVEEVVCAADARGRPRKVALGDVTSLLIRIDQLHFPVLGHWQNQKRQLATLLERCSLERSHSKRHVSAAGVVARILHAARVESGSIAHCVKRVGEAIAREERREAARRKL